ncbi:uncharacterized protein [Amphiura filiformis]|uniref:uncharacterized protein n=1 Tax=Amphiura filiformis TaxID=82378 RepID=UPI003B20D466
MTCIEYKDTYSDWVLLNGGVSQGTVIGPLSFLGMINDALDIPNHKVWKYVDDLTSGENRAYGEASTVQDSLDSLSTWADENKLRLNPAKCQALQVYFGRREVPDVDLHISNHQLAVVDKVKLLGTMIQNDLKWDSQVDSMCIYALKQTAKCL